MYLFGNFLSIFNESMMTVMGIPMASFSFLPDNYSFAVFESLLAASQKTSVPPLESYDTSYMMDVDAFVEWPILPQWIHNAVGSYIVAIGTSGTFLLLRILLSYKDKSSRSASDILLMNLFLANLFICIGQFPFSSSSSFHGSWLFGDHGCQLYALAGFVFGNGSILALAIVVYDQYLVIVEEGFARKPLKERVKYYWNLIILQWMGALVLSAPPALGIFGRYYYEPSGTMCTIDYWHGNFRDYQVYISLLTIFGFLLPLGYSCYLFVSAVNELRWRKVHDESSKKALDYHINMAKFCGLSLVAVLVLWSPYAVLCLWPLAFGVQAINVYFTLIPPIMAKANDIACPLTVGFLAYKYISPK